MSWYGRDWILSRPQQYGRYLQGRLGFERPASDDEVTFDADEQDFVVSATPREQGNFSHYVLDLDTRVLAYEERRPDIRRQSFAGAVAALVTPYNYEVDVVPDERGFDAFVADVDVVSRFSANMNRANPSASRRARDTYRAIFIEPNPDKVQLVLQSDSQGEKLGINVGSDVVQGAAAHVMQTNGRVQVTGYKGGTRRFFDSARHLLSASISATRDELADGIFERIRALMEDLDPVANDEEDRSEERESTRER